MPPGRDLHSTHSFSFITHTSHGKHTLSPFHLLFHTHTFIWVHVPLLHTLLHSSRVRSEFRREDQLESEREGGTDRQTDRQGVYSFLLQLQ